MREKIPALIFLFFILLAVFGTKDVRLDILFYISGAIGFFVSRNILMKIPKSKELVGDMVVKGIKKSIDKADGFFVISLDKNYPQIDIERINTKTKDEAKAVISKYNISTLEKLIDGDISKRNLIKVYEFDSRNLKLLLTSIIMIIGVLEDIEIRKKGFVIALDMNKPRLEALFVDDLKSKYKIRKLLKPYIKKFEYIRIYDSKMVDFEKLQERLIEFAKVLNSEIKSRTEEDYITRIKESCHKK